MTSLLTTDPAWYPTRSLIFIAVPISFSFSGASFFAGISISNYNALKRKKANYSYNYIYPLFLSGIQRLRHRPK